MGLPAFFVLGVGRSGTSILGYALSRHPRLFVSHELRVLELALLAAALVDRDGEPLVQEPAGYSPLGLAFGAAFAEALGVAQLEHERKPDGIYADKYPPYGSRIGALHSLFPDARFVHILRDGRDVAASAARAFVADRGWRREREIPRIAELAAHWAQEISRARAQARKLPAGRWHELRYEELVLRPREVLAELLRFLGIGDEGALESMAGVLRPGPDWRTTLAPEELCEFDACEPARALLAELGYPATPAGAGRAFPRLRRELRSLCELPDGPERRACARALLARAGEPESLLAALHAREAPADEDRAALARWTRARGLDARAARALFGAEEELP